jgi:hypothetical protein
MILSLLPESFRPILGLSPLHGVTATYLFIPLHLKKPQNTHEMSKAVGSKKIEHEIHDKPDITRLKDSVIKNPVFLLHVHMQILE